jgi:ribonuclease VapC
MVVDTSAVLAVFFAEPYGAWAAAQMQTHARELRMSTVNLAEALVLIRDRQPTLADELAERLLTSGIRFVPPDVEQARIAADARLRLPLNFGDCFAYALAVTTRTALLAVDADFRAVDTAVVLPP